jgi:hypothetical protein
MTDGRETPITPEDPEIPARRGPMTPERVRAWLAAYIEAWRSYDAAASSSSGSWSIRGSAGTNCVR